MISFPFQKLKRIPYIVQIAWSSGEFFHRTLPKFLENNNTQYQAKVSPEQTIGVSEESAPLYPHPSPPTNSFDVTAPSESLNPVLTAKDVTDFGRVHYVADPFIIPDGDTWHMFFEICNRDRTPDAVIGHATSKDGYNWSYDRVVLNTGLHLSFPYVFKWDGEYYMVPEEGGYSGDRITIYCADDFPYSWEEYSVPVKNQPHSNDSAIFRWKGRFWLLISDSEIDGIWAYYSDDLSEDNWTSHNFNPIISERPRAGRLGGRPIIRDGTILLFLQDCENYYGDKVRVFEVGNLTPDDYNDRELSQSPILEGQENHLGWNSGHMHHIDAWNVGDYWLCAVDGNIGFNHLLFTPRHWSIGIFISQKSPDVI
ncbi:glucosamine inositolphosphorylceramide transferase family protein [Natrialbaceae archaeon A-gly3]